MQAAVIIIFMVIMVKTDEGRVLNAAAALLQLLQLLDVGLQRPLPPRHRLLLLGLGFFGPPPSLCLPPQVRHDHSHLLRADFLQNGVQRGRGAEGRRDALFQLNQRGGCLAPSQLVLRLGGSMLF